MKRALASLMIWLALAGAAVAQCAGGISGCPAATSVAPTDLTVISQPLSTSPTGFATKKATITQIGSAILSAPNTWTGLQTFTGGIVTNVLGSTQCIHVNSAGLISGTGSDCGAGGGGTPGGSSGNIQFNNSGAFGGLAQVDVPRGGTGVGTFTANLPLIGNGTGNIAQGTRSGNTTSFATTSGALTNTHTVVIDASGNLIDAGGAPTTFTPVAPLALGGGNLSITGAAGQVLGGAGPAFTATPVLGTNAAATGTLGLANGAGGGATVTVQNNGATAPYNFNLPITAGAVGAILTSGGGGATQNVWLPDVALGQVIISGGTGTIPAYSATLPAAVQANITAVGTITAGTWNGTAIANANLANMNSNTIKGNVTGGTAAPTDLTVAQIFTLLAANNNLASPLYLFNANVILTPTNPASPAYEFKFGPPLFQVITDSNRTAIVGQSVQMLNGSVGANQAIVPAVIGYGVLTTAGIGNQVQGMFARGECQAAGGCTGIEIDAWNTSSSDAPDSYPAADSYGTSSTWTFGTKIAAAGTKINWAGIEFVQEPTSPGNSQFRAGIYAAPAVFQHYGLFFDADATHSPTNSMLVRNTGQGGNIHATFQTMGTAVPANAYLQHQNASGLVTSQINQDGTLLVNKSATPQAAPTVGVDFYARGADTSVFGAGNWFDAFGGAGFTVYRRADGTGGAPTAIATGEIIGLFSSKIYVNGAYTTDTARVTFQYTGAGGASSDNGTQIQIATTPNGTAVLQQAGIFADDGSLALGNTNRWGYGAIGLVGPLATGAPPAAKTANYSMSAGTTGTPGDSSLIFNGSGSITLTLLSAAAYQGRWLFLLTIANQTVVSASSNVVPLAGGAAGTAILAGTAGKWAFLQSNGTAWQIMASN